MGGYNPGIFDEVLRFNEIELSGVIIDYTLPDEEIREIRMKIDENNIPEIGLDDIPAINPDMVFLCGYTKILKSEYINRYLFVNIHAGILPKWRGFNANCWAILNGENHIGYTIHRVREGLDAGEIYKIIKIELSPNETYASGRSRIKDLLCQDLENIFLGIIKGSIVAEKQKEEGIIYNCKLRKTDGNIKDWNKSSIWLNGLMRVFGCQPDGTGVRMYIQGTEYTITNMEIASEIGSSQGIPGAVINIYQDGSALIKAQDTAIRLKMIKDMMGNDILPSSVLKIGMRL